MDQQRKGNGLWHRQQKVLQKRGAIKLINQINS